MLAASDGTTLHSLTYGERLETDRQTMMVVISGVIKVTQYTEEYVEL